ncbi:TPA: hypothetical protein ACYLN4_007578 [Burkholderia lata]
MLNAFFILHAPSEAAANGGAGFWSAENGWSSFDSAMQYSSDLVDVLPLPKSVRGDAGWVQVDSPRFNALAQKFSDNPSLPARHDNLSERYTEMIVAGRVDFFNAFDGHRRNFRGTACALMDARAPF